MKHKHLAGFAAVAALTLVITACSPSGEGDTQGEVDRDAVLRVAVKSVPVNLDPAHAGNYGSVAPWLDTIYDRLLRTAPSGEVQPMLATSWEFVDDGAALRLELRTDVTFTDDSPFNAEVAKANLDRYRSADAVRAVQTSLSSVESVEIVDEFTIDIITAEGAGADLPAMLADMAGFMVSGEALDNPDLDQNPVGSGPYELTEYVPSVSTVVERRDIDYWGGADEANFAKIIVESVPDQRTMLDAMVSGKYDIMVGDTDERTAGMEKQGRFTVLNKDGGFVGVMFNKNRVPEFDDVRVRQAFSYAIDRKSIAEVTLSGACRPTQQMVMKDAEGYIPELDKAYQFDPDKARALFAEAGVTSMDLNALFIAQSPTAEIAEAVQSMLADVGVTISFEAITTAIQTTTWLEGKADIRMSSQSMMPDQGRLLLRGTDDPTIMGLDSPEVAEASVGLIDSTLSYDERVDVIKATNTAMVEQAFNIVICHRSGSTITVPELVGAEEIGSRARGSLDFRPLALMK